MGTWRSHHLSYFLHWRSALYHEHGSAFYLAAFQSGTSVSLQAIFDNCNSPHDLCEAIVDSSGASLMTVLESAILESISN